MRSNQLGISSDERGALFASREAPPRRDDPGSTSPPPTPRRQLRWTPGGDELRPPNRWAAHQVTSPREWRAKCTWTDTAEQQRKPRPISTRP